MSELATQAGNLIERVETDLINCRIFERFRFRFEFGFELKTRLECDFPHPPNNYNYWKKAGCSLEASSRIESSWQKSSNCFGPKDFQSGNWIKFVFNLMQDPMKVKRINMHKHICISFSICISIAVDRYFCRKWCASLLDGTTTLVTCDIDATFAMARASDVNAWNMCSRTMVT